MSGNRLTTSVRRVERPRAADSSNRKNASAKRVHSGVKRTAPLAAVTVVEDYKRALGTLPEWADDLIERGDDLTLVAEAVELIGEAGLDMSTPEGFAIAVQAARRRQALIREGGNSPRSNRPMPPPGPRYVYYLVNGTRIKIGVSVNPRLRGQTMGEYIAAVEPGGYELERSRHKQFEHLRAFGEWFEMAPDLIAHVEAMRVHAMPAGVTDSTGGLRYAGTIPAGQLTTAEVGEKLGVKASTVRAWCQRGRIRRTPEGGLLMAEVLAYLKDRDAYLAARRNEEFLREASRRAPKRRPKTPRHADQLMFDDGAKGM